MAEVGVSGIQSKEIQPGTKTTGAYLPLLPGQTVCTFKDEKGNVSVDAATKTPISDQLNIAIHLIHGVFVIARVTTSDA